MYAARLFISIFALAMTATLAQITSGPSYLDVIFGGGTYATLPSSISTLSGKSFSFEAWVKVPAIGNQMAIASRINSSASVPSDAQNDFSLQINAQGYVILALGGITEFGFLLPSKNPLVINTWYHVAFSIEYTNLASDAPYRANLFVDSYDSTGALTRDYQNAYWYGPGYSRVVLINEVITVGKYINTANPSGIFFSGSMDDVRVWQGVRTGSDIKSYSFVSVDNWTDAHWSLTSSQGGTSTNVLTASFNFNQFSSKSSRDVNPTIVDQSQFGHNGTFFGPITLEANTLHFLQYAHVNGEVPLIIPLYGLDSVTASSANIQFFVYWSGEELGGELYNYEVNGPSIAVNTTPLFPYDARPAVTFSTLIVNNTQVDTTDSNSLVYILFGNRNQTNGRFRYYAVFNGVQSAVTEVRLVFDCVGNRSAIDDCGVCGGDNSTCRQCIWDACGVCNGTNSTCLGCDGVPNSGKTLDRCGVCDGKNLCLGCDHMGGGVKDACGVCNGDNSTCGGCVLDACGVCNGNATSCSCMHYHGYHVQELDYLLLRWGFTNALSNIDQILVQLEESLSLLQGYDGDADLASMVAYVNEFSTDFVVPYDTEISQFVVELNKALGVTE